MSYHTFRSELTAAPAQDYMSNIAIDSVNDEIARLHNLKIGVIDTIMIPNRTKMDTYILKRVEYLDNLAPIVTLQDGSTQIREWEWRTQLNSASVSARGTYAKHICATGEYGNRGERSSTLSNWTMEKWSKAKKPNTRSHYYRLCAAYLGDNEYYTDISDTTISQAGLADQFTIAELQLAAADWYIGMNWIHATNTYRHPDDGPPLAHYNAYASHGIDYLIISSQTGLNALDARRQHYTDLASLCARYYTI